jgi:ketosteroid isomerase-like protein
MTPLTGAAAGYRAGLEAGDHVAMLATLSPDVVLVSPMTSRFRFEGIAEVRELFEVIFEELGVTEVEVRAEAPGEAVAALFHKARVGRVTIEEATYLEIGDDGRITRITLYIRPLPAATGLLAILGPRLARRRSRPRAIAAKLAMAPLALLTRHGDGFAPWLAGRSGR